MFVAIGERGDAVATWSSTARPAVWAALRSPGHGFRRPQRLAADASDAPSAALGANGAAALIYSTQHVPLRPGDGLQLHRALRGGAFGPAEHVNGGGGVTVAEAAVTPAGRVLVAWCDRCTARGCMSPRPRRARRWPPPPSWAPTCAAKRIAVAADDAGRAVVAWSQRASTAPAYRERAVAALRAAAARPSVRPSPWAGRGERPSPPWRGWSGAGRSCVDGARYGGRRGRRSALRTRCAGRRLGAFKYATPRYCAAAFLRCWSRRRTWR